MKSQLIRYYTDYNNFIIKPKIEYQIKNSASYFFVIEWIEYVSYFKKICEFLEFYIIKSLVNNFYSKTKFISSRQIITKIIENLNFYIYDKIHYDYFFSF